MKKIVRLFLIAGLCVSCSSMDENQDVSDSSASDTSTVYDDTGIGTGSVTTTGAGNDFGSDDSIASTASADSNSTRPKEEKLLWVIAPITVIEQDTFANGCWARVYDGHDFKGDWLTVVGPNAAPDMTVVEKNWTGEIDSVEVGPNAKLTLYGGKSYTDKDIVFNAGTRTGNLRKVHALDDIESMILECQQ